MKREFAILKALVRDWKRASSNPKIARMILLKRRYFQTEQVRMVVGELVLADGDIHRAVQALRGHSPAWLSKFVKWCDQVRGGAK